MTKLELLRRNRGWLQKDCAERLRITRQHLSMIENGWITRVQPRLEGRMQRLFGKEWTYASLMKKLDDPKPE